MALSSDIRSRIIAAYKSKEGGYQRIADRFSVGICSVRRLVRLERETGDIKCRHHGARKSPKITSEQLSDLVALVKEKPDRTAEELMIEWQKRYQVELSRSSMVRALNRAGLSLKKRPFERSSVILKRTRKSVGSS